LPKNSRPRGGQYRPPHTNPQKRKAFKKGINVRGGSDNATGKFAQHGKRKGFPTGSERVEVFKEKKKKRKEEGGKRER